MHVIELRKVSAGYGKKQVLQDVSISFEKGKLISLIGPNGSGKSTLLKSIIGVIQPDVGEIIADNVSLATLKAKEIAKRIAFLAQGKSTPDMTVEQMVLHGRFPHLSYPRRYTQKDREIACVAMEQMEISNLAERTMASLSGGMRQNAYIAMALAQGTDYILLDEPTTYLDIAHQLELMRILKNLAEAGKGVVIVMHDLPLAFNFSDEIVVLNEGKVMMQDVPKVVCDSGLVDTVFGIQLQRLDEQVGYSYRYL